MKKHVYILIILAIMALVLVTQKLQKQKLEFIQITCGQGQDEVQYIATKEENGKFLVEGELREFKDCKKVLVKP